MTELYIHGGMQKTGTSYLQTFLAANRENFKKYGTIVPDFSDIHINNPISASRNGHWLSRKKADAEIRDKAYARLGELSKTYEKIILTDEILWNDEFSKLDFWEEMMEKLAPYDIQVRVVVYLRRQDHYIYSFWAQNIKSMISVPYKAQTFSEYLDHQEYYRFQQLDYREILNTMEFAVGRKNILVRVYEKEQFEGEARTIRSDFLKTVGLPDDDSYKETKEVRINTSLKDSVLETKRLLNRLPEFSVSKEVGGTDLYTEVIRSVQNQMEKEGLLRNRTGFTNARRRAFMQAYEEGNADVARRFLNRPDGILFYEQIPEDDDEQAEFSKEELIEVCGRIIVTMHDRIVRLETEKKKLEKDRKSGEEKSQRMPDHPVKNNVRSALRKFKKN